MDNYKTFEAGDKVRDNFGKEWIVISQNGCMVYVEGKCSGHIHPSNLRKI